MDTREVRFWDGFDVLHGFCIAFVRYFEVSHVVLWQDEGACSAISVDKDDVVIILYVSAGKIRKGISIVYSTKPIVDASF